MEDVFENEPVPSDPDGQPKHFNGSGTKNVSLRILSMPSSPLPPGPGVMPSSPSAISLSSATARDTRHRTSKDRVSRKARVSTISPGGMVAGGENFASTVATIDEGGNDGGNSPTAASLAPCSNTAVVKKSKVDFVRFDSTEIHYTENEEVRKKISDEIKSVATAVHGQLYQVRNNGNNFRIEKVTDSTLKHALDSISLKWNVKELDLSGNLLSKISVTDLTSFTKLELLNLSSNVFSETLDLGALRTLKTVDLNNNFVKQLVVGSSIERLYAANNHISKVTCYNYSPSQQSKIIDLANNKIGSLVDLSHECRSNVETLDLKVNEIDTVDFAELAASANTLKYLYLQHNFIFDVRNTQNVVFSLLHTLDLASNKLAFMGPEFKAASSARSIDLSNNKLVMVAGDLKFSEIESFDLRDNGFHCSSLKVMFTKNSNLMRIANETVRRSTRKDVESCSDKKDYSGPYCCEKLSAPFADRLIKMKHKEYALFSRQPSPNELEECERANAARQQAITAIHNQYRTTLDEETRRNQEQIVLTQEKTGLEDKLKTLQVSYDELKNELEHTANELNVTAVPDLPQLLRNIVARYEQLNTEEQNLQNNYIKDWEMYQMQETKLLEDNERLKKLNEDVEMHLQKANSTLQGLITREETLSKALSVAQN
ncbi:uncharacterized protein LOC128713059 [Anopheles marshallii]|uniref:uncharacterized protein LOC128713059 n=1 Tax=Anopheles marshallii TaxID=1521116 RepID=UPI00237BC7AA|nr:uncharacterized protein LOC128713059 [Anopheles marshallii]